MNFIDSLLMAIPTGLWAVVSAALILILAFIVAKIVQSLVTKLLTKTKLSGVVSKLDSGEGSTSLTDFIGKFVYLFVFLLFVPGVFNALGMNSISAPILLLLNSIWGYVPNVLAAAIILVVSFQIAKYVRQLLVPVFAKLNIDKLQEKAGIEVADSAKLSNTLAYIVYVLILIPMIIMALHVLDISVISDPAIHMLNTIFDFIPNILVALIIILLGCMIGKFVGQIVTQLIASAGLDAKLSKLIEGKNEKFVLSKVVGTVCHTVVIIFFVVESFNTLHLSVLSEIGLVVIAYMPYVLSAILIFAICYFAAAFAEKTLKKNGFTSYAVVAKAAIFTVGAFMVLNQLGIATEIVNAAFILILAALAVAFAIAFGIGGKDFAANALKKFGEKTEKKDA
ncbi:MAG: mechanosensitive ion channel [Alistipes sp.]|nr:mechanosensitive ion channel [Alistipes sp.]